MLARVLGPRGPGAEAVAWKRALHGCLGAAVVRVGVAVLRLVGARPRLVCGSRRRWCRRWLGLGWLRRRRRTWFPDREK